MPGKGRKSRRRVRGSDGKLYDPKKQRDNGYQAHETRVATAARRTKWRLSRFGTGFASAVFLLISWLIVRPAWTVTKWLGAAWRRLTGATKRPTRRGRRN